MHALYVSTHTYHILMTMPLTMSMSVYHAIIFYAAFQALLGSLKSGSVVIFDNMEHKLENNAFVTFLPGFVDFLIGYAL
jgi:hypothetical protein